MTSKQKKNCFSKPRIGFVSRRGLLWVATGATILLSLATTNSAIAAVLLMDADGGSHAVSYTDFTRTPSSANLSGSPSATQSGGSYTVSAHNGVATVASGSTANPTFAITITNNTSSILTSLSFAADLNVYKFNDGNRAETLTAAVTGLSGFSASLLNIVAPSTSTAGLPNGANAGFPKYTTLWEVDLSGFSLDIGASFTITWRDANDSGTDAMFGIGDLVVSWDAGPPPATGNYWDSNGATDGVGGSGAWTDTGTFWNNQAGTGAPVAFDSTKEVVFEGDPGVVTVAADANDTVVHHSNLRFNVDGYSIEGDGLNLTGNNSGAAGVAGTPVVTVTNADHTAIINSSISGGRGLAKSGAGKLVLGGANTFLGDVEIRNGILEIGADENLGAKTNNVTMTAGSTLRTSATMTLGASEGGRNFSGSGSIDVATGTTLTVEGNVSMAALNLTGEGTLDLLGTSRNVGALSFTAGATLSASGTDPGENVITATTLSASSLSGTATVTADLNLGAGVKTVDVGVNGILQMNGKLMLTGTGTNSLTKAGQGVLALNADNSNSLYRIQIGSGTTSGGIVRLGHKGALGQQQTFFNFGAIEASTDLTGENAISTGLSIGSSPAAKAVLGDQGGANNENMEFKGGLNFFGTTEKYLEVYNTTILSGDWTAAASPPTVFTIGGTGKLVMDGNATSIFVAAPVPGANLSDTRLVDAVTLQVNNNWGSDILVQGTATLEGGKATSLVNGGEAAPIILGNVTVEGSGGTGGRLSIGRSGVAEASTLKIAGSLTVSGTLEFDIFNRTAGDNGTANADLLVFTGDSSESVTLSGVIQINADTLDASVFEIGDAWRLIDWGGVGTRNVNLDPGLMILPELSGVGYYWDLTNLATTGYITVAPEPSRAVLLVIGAAGFLLRRRRNRSLGASV